MSSHRRYFLKACGLGLALLIAGNFAPARASADDAGSDVKLVIIVTRHGVRSPLPASRAIGNAADYAAQPWPRWEVPPGHLTPHGKRQMALMGAYYRARYTRPGLLTGDPAQDLARVFFRADSDERTIETARDLGAGLLPGASPVIHARPDGRTDPLFQPVKLPVGHPDRALGVAAVLGRLGGDPAVIPQAYAPAFATLERVLLGGDGAPPAGKRSVLDLPAAVQPGEGDHTVDLRGPLYGAVYFTESLVLEYADGRPLAEVGWGRVTPATLTQLLALHARYFDLTQRTFYPAQVQGSNLASHLLKTLEQAASGRPDPGAIGAPGEKLVLVVGHDTNLANLGGLLGFSWWLPGTQANPVLPGGALVFELRQRRGDGGFAVRTYYVSQTLGQMRALSPLTRQNPPAIAPIFIPGCSEAGPGFDVPLSRFAALLHRVIDPHFVLPGSS